MLHRTLFLVVFLFCYGSIIAQPPSPQKVEQARMLFNDGVKSGISEDFEKAVEQFDEATSLNPLYAEAFLYRGLAWIELGDYDLAVKDFTITIELDPGFSDQAHYFRGLARYMNDQLVPAINDFSVAIRMNPDYVAFFQRGKANLKLQEYNRSLQDFDIAIRLEEDFYQAYIYRGINLYYLGSYEEAMHDLEIAKEHFPNNSKVFYYSGLVRTALQNSYVAIEDLDRAIELDPENADAYQARAVARQNTGNPQAASEDREKVQQLQARDPVDKTKQPHVAEVDETQKPRTQSTRTQSTDIDFSELFGASRTPDTDQKTQMPAQEDPQHQHASTEASVKTKSSTAQPETISLKDLRNVASGTYNANLSKVYPAVFGVQVASYSSTENLLNLASAYREKYEKEVFINVAMVNNRKLFKLIIGEFAQRGDAEQFRDSLRQQSFPDAFLIVFDNL